MPNQAVTALDDSNFKFNDNEVRARFYNSEKFEKGIYE
jgi:splicing factor 45